jgi:MFS transporter, DHA3 family, macrolide efflux protein
MIDILKRPTFLLFFIGNIISLIGFGFNIISISWLVLEETNSEFALGKILAIATVPGLILALFAGVIIDQVNRKWLLVSLDIFRMIVVFTFLVIIKIDSFQLIYIYPFVILMGLGNSLFWPTAQAFVQEIVNENEYFSANALLSASYQVGSILGAGIGGFIVHFFSPISALWINGFAYLISAIFIGVAPFKRSKKSAIRETIFESLSKGFSFLIKRKDVLFVGLTTILSDVAIWGSLSVLTISISKEVFNKGTWGYGLMDGFYGIGALLSTVIISWLVAKAGREKSLLTFYLIATSMCIIAPKVSTIYLASFAYFFMGLNNNSARIIIRTIFMENIPNLIMGRVQTIFGVYTRTMVLLSSLFAGWLVENQSIFSGMIFASFHYILAFLGIITLRYISDKKRNLLSIDVSNA